MPGPADYRKEFARLTKLAARNRKLGREVVVVVGLGFVGAAIYFISTATGLWIGVLGFLKAIVWPAFLVYQAFQFLAR